MADNRPIIDVSQLEGLFVGMLTEGELQDFSRAIALGWAFRSYEGASGLLGMAKVAITDAGRAALQDANQ